MQTTDEGSALSKAISRMDAKEVAGFALADGANSIADVVHALWTNESLLDKRSSKKFATRRKSFLIEVASAVE